jgi:hypothetical protein
MASIRDDLLKFQLLYWNYRHYSSILRVEFLLPVQCICMPGQGLNKLAIGEK